MKLKRRWWARTSYEPGLTNGQLIILGVALTVATLLAFGWATHWFGVETK